MARIDRGAYLASLEPPERRAALARLSDRERRSLRTHWNLWAHEGQIAPPGDWLAWLIMAGRGFGKTRAGAEWVRAIAQNDGSARIALVGASLVEARAVMVEGESGLLAVCPPARAPRFEPSLRRLVWPNGAQAMLYSAQEPESLRGPQHSDACRPIAEGGLRQRGTGPDRWPAAWSDRRHPVRAACHSCGWPDLAGWHRTKWSMERAGRQAGASPGRQLGLRLPARRHAPARSLDRTASPLSWWLACAIGSDRAQRRHHCRQRGARRDSGDCRRAARCRHIPHRVRAAAAPSRRHTAKAPCACRFQRPTIRNRGILATLVAIEPLRREYIGGRQRPLGGSKFSKRGKL